MATTIYYLLTHGDEATGVFHTNKSVVPQHSSYCSLFNTSFLDIPPPPPGQSRIHPDLPRQRTHPTQNREEDPRRQPSCRRTAPARRRNGRVEDVKAARDGRRICGNAGAEGQDKLLDY